MVAQSSPAPSGAATATALDSAPANPSSAPNLLPHPQVFSLFDRSISSALLKLLRDGAAGKKAPAGKGGKKAAGGGAGGDAMDVDQPGSDDEAGGGDDEGHSDGPGPSQRGGGGSQKAGGAVGGGAAHLAEAFANLAALLAGFGLRDQPDTVRTMAEAAAEVSRAPGAQGAASEACYTLLTALLQPIHGSVREVSKRGFGRGLCACSVAWWLLCCFVSFVARRPIVL